MWGSSDSHSRGARPSPGEERCDSEDGQDAASDDMARGVHDCVHHRRRHGVGAVVLRLGSKQQVILHGQGASHCRARGSAGACYILENSKGTFEVDPGARKCERTSQWGSVPPTWVAPGVFAGVVEVNGVKCNRFDYPPSMHLWLETVDGGLPCAFLFPVPSLTYIFAPSTLKLEKPASNIFSVPEYCPQGTSQGASRKGIL